MLKVYSKALDLILSAVASASAGKPVKAAKFLAQAMGEEDFEQTMDALNDQQDQSFQQEQDPDFGVDDLDGDGFDDQQQQSFSRALARVTANTKAVKAAEGDNKSADDKDESDDKMSDKEVDAGSGMFDNEGDDAESVKIEHASADDDSSDDKPAFLKEKDESKVMSSAKSRLARQERAQANVAALSKKNKKAKK